MPKPTRSMKTMRKMVSKAALWGVAGLDTAGAGEGGAWGESDSGDAVGLMVIPPRRFTKTGHGANSETVWLV